MKMQKNEKTCSNGRGSSAGSIEVRAVSLRLTGGGDDDRSGISPEASRCVKIPARPI